MPEPTPDRRIADATCLACGCLCDDVELAVAGGRVVEARRACPIGRAWFLADRDPAGRPEATVDGRAVDPPEALDRAAAILRAARAPAVLGLSGATIEDVAAAVALADRLGALADPSHAAGAAPRFEAVARAGRVGASLGEVRQRADLVLFWGCDPAATHPRFFERFVDPPGRFSPSGRAGRAILAVDAGSTAALADATLAVDPARQFEALWALRGLVRGLDLDAGRVEVSTGLPLADLAAWAARLASARYGVLAWGDGLARAGAATVEAALRLVVDLNERGRFAAIGLGGPGNPAGAESVLAWQAGAPLGVDFGRGYPHSLIPETSAAARLAAGEVDAAVIVGPVDDLGAVLAGRLGSIPVVAIGPGATGPDRAGSVAVALDAATPGIDGGGTAARMDGVELPLRPPLGPYRPPSAAWLSALLARLPDGLASTPAAG